MKIKNNIGWCDDTTNAVTGCTKVSPGCDNCFAEQCTPARVARHQGRETWGGHYREVHTGGMFGKFMLLNKKCVCDTCHKAYPEGFRRRGDVCACGGTLRKPRLFADSNSDWLDIVWPVESRVWLLYAIMQSTNVEVQLLTKRPQLFRKLLVAARDAKVALPKAGLNEWIDNWLHGKPPENVLYGVSVEDQLRANQRVPVLLATPAAFRWVSAEPLLEYVRLTCCGTEPTPYNALTPTYMGLPFQHTAKVDWVVVGGESGKRRRFTPLACITDLADQCIKYHVPLYVKQDTHLVNGQRGRIPANYWAYKQVPIR